MPGPGARQIKRLAFTLSLDWDDGDRVCRGHLCLGTLSAALATLVSHKVLIAEASLFS